MQRQLIISLSSLFFAVASHADQSDISQVAADNQVYLTQGKPEKFIAALESVAGKVDSKRLLFAGNIVYGVSLEPAIKLHSAAQVLDPKNNQISLELAFDYIAAGDCVKANAELEKFVPRLFPLVNKLDIAQLRPTLAAVAAYCALKTGDVTKALQFWARADYRNAHIATDQVIGETFGRTAALAWKAHADGFKHYQVHGWGASGAWVRNAYQWKLNWWQTDPNPSAIKAIRAALLKKQDHKALHELDCLDAAKVASTDAEKDKRLCDWSNAPINSGVAYLYSVYNADTQALAKSWSKALAQRARSKNGDIDALELLAHFYASTRQQAELAEIDELGWQRYRLVGFAISGLAGKGALERPQNAAQLALFSKALKDFPEEPMLLMNDMVLNHSTGEDYKQALIKLILAEFKTPRFSSELSAAPNARGINDFFARLAVINTRLSEGKKVSVFDNYK
jgi:hypothetical protein